MAAMCRLIAFQPAATGRVYLSSEWSEGFAHMKARQTALQVTDI
jgi:hypothetical protein